MTGPSKSLHLLIACGGLFFGVLFISVGWLLWRQGHELGRAGVTVAATVRQKLRRDDDRSWGGLENYYVRCAFNAEGEAREVEIKVQSRLWRQLREGSTLHLTYVPGQMETARAGSRFAWQTRGFVGAVMMVFGVVALVVFPLGVLRDWLKAGG